MEQPRKREELGRSVGCSQQEQKKTFWTKLGVWPTSYKHSLAWQNLYKSFPDCTRRTLVSYPCIRLKSVHICITSSVQNAQAKWAACFSTSHNFLVSCNFLFTLLIAHCHIISTTKPKITNARKFKLKQRKVLKPKKQCNSNSCVGSKMAKQESVQNIHWRKNSQDY